MGWLCSDGSGEVPDRVGEQMGPTTGAEIDAHLALGVHTSDDQIRHGLTGDEVQVGCHRNRLITRVHRGVRRTVASTTVTLKITVAPLGMPTRPTTLNSLNESAVTNPEPSA